jgi:ATP-binding cassette, subfamily B, multidrug efflux pump
VTKILKYLKPYTLGIVVILVLTYIQVMATLKLPDYMAKIINEGIVAQNNSVIWDNGMWMLAIALFGAVCTIALGYLSSKVATDFSRRLRDGVFSKVESFSMQEFDKFSTASLITRSTNDIQQIQMVFLMILRMVLAAPFTAVGAVVKAYKMAPSMSWILALAVIVLMGMITVIFTAALPKFKLLQKLVDKLNLVTRENLTGLRVIRAFNAEKYEEKKFEKANRELTDVNLFVNRLMVVMQPMMTLIFSFSAVAIVWFGAKLIGTGDLAIGDMVAFMQYAMQVIMSFLMLSFIFIMVPRASVSISRVAEVLATEPVICDPEKPKKFAVGKKGIIVFKDVSFSYPGAESPVLKNISFEAHSGETTAFIGSTGSGKSTLVNLIPRFYDVTKGEILIDGLDIREVSQKDLCDKIGYVPQRGVLFSGSIRSNIKYGAPKATEKDLVQAIKTAQSQDFIMDFVDKYDTNIAQGGTNVSGGQKQRLSIARAIIKKPEIYIFDDSFSALDFRTDAALRAALAKETKNVTVLIVAQRVSTIINADKIIVLDEGKIVGMGKHSELMKTSTVYREIAHSQLSEKELS